MFAWALFRKKKGVSPACPFSIRINPGRLNPRQFWWSIFEGGRVAEQSRCPYETRREAKLAADEALKKYMRKTSFP